MPTTIRKGGGNARCRDRATYSPRPYEQTPFITNQMTTRLYVGILLYMLSLCMASHAPASPVPQNVEKKEKTQQLKKQMKSIREALKGKKGADALKGVENIRKDTAEWWNIQALQYGVEACRLLADTENEKLYLKHNPDTTAFFNAIYNICRYVLLTDSAERFQAFADSMEGRRASYKYRRQNAGMLAKHMGNMLTAPLYFTAKGNWKEAQRFAHIDITMLSTPWLSQKSYPDSASIVALAVIHANACYNLADNHEIERFATLALQDSATHESILERLIYAETNVGDTLKYLPRLEEGHQKYPFNIFFLSRIVDYNIQKRNFDTIVTHTAYSLDAIRSLQLLTPDAPDSLLHAHRITRDMVALCYEALAIAHYNKENYRASIDNAREILKWVPSHPRADFFVGASYYQMAKRVRIPNSINDPDYRKNYRERNRLLEMARPYLELYRKNNPDDARFWAPILYDIYLYLNLGPEFEEISRHLPSS